MGEDKKNNVSKFYAGLKGGMLSYNLSAIELIIYGTIHGFSEGGNSFCNSSYSQFCVITGQGRTQVIAAIKSLEEKGFIKSITQNNSQKKAYFSVLSRTKEDFPESGFSAVKKTDSIQIQGWMRQYEGLDAKDLILLGIVEKHSYDGKSVYVSSMPEMMAWTGIKKEDNIRSHLRKLIEVNAIECLEMGEGKAKRYYTTHSRANTPPKTDTVYESKKEKTPPKNDTVTTPETDIAPPESDTVTPPETDTSNNISKISDNTAANKQTPLNSDLQNSAAVFLHKYNNIFEQSIELSQDYFKKILPQIPESQFEDFLKFAKEKISGKAKSNFNGYFYRTTQLQSFIDSFKTHIESKTQKAEQAKKNKKTCPVCSGIFDGRYVYNCPHCSFDVSFFDNKIEIENAKILRSFSESKREAYEKELLYKPEVKFPQRLNPEFKQKEEAHIKSVYEKYGLTVA